jgi:hypothetical protein
MPDADRGPDALDGLGSDVLSAFHETITVTEGQFAEAEDLALGVEGDALVAKLHVRERVNHPVDTREAVRKLVGPSFVVAVEPVNLGVKRENWLDNSVIPALVNLHKPLTLDLLRLAVYLVPRHRAHVKDIPHHEHNVGAIVTSKGKHRIERPYVMDRALDKLPLRRHALVVPKVNVTEC